MISATARGSALTLTATWDEHSPVRLWLRLPGQQFPAVTAQPAVEALASGHPRHWAGRRLVATAIGARLRHRSHHLTRSGPWQTLSLAQQDDITGLEFVSVLSLHDDHRGMRAVTRVRNTGGQAVTLYALTSLVFADFGVGGARGLDGLTLLRGRSDWLAEGRWTERRLRDWGLPDLTAPGRVFRSRGCLEASSNSSWPTSDELPVGVLREPSTGRAWSFQIEHNGPWLWQVGELADGAYLALSGPTDEQHHWQHALAPGDSFETVPASIALEDDAGGPVGALTAFRRVSTERTGGDALAVVFNDYMNTVYGDPSAQVLHPLIDAAADVGAECFVVDAGWYAGDGDWWDSVGEWQPSTTRFPKGIGDVIDHIRGRGMTAGLWLEPEVVGVNSPMAVTLPDRAFLRRSGTRVIEHGRYHLDLTADVAVEFLDAVVDRLVRDLGVGYLKLDYNIRAGVGSDAVVASPGHGLLLHNRAYLAWVDRLRRRHPQLVLENCASGGMRQDHATVSRFDLTSTSDQEDPRAYPPVAASAPMLVLPEQAGNWACPQPDMCPREIVFTLCTGMLGRLYLSGWLDRLDAEGRGLVTHAVEVYKSIRHSLPGSSPFWPRGLPRWDDQWIAAGLRTSDDTLLMTVWRRGTEPGSVALLLPPAPADRHWGEPEALFPVHSPLTVTHRPAADTIHVEDRVGEYAARTLRLSAVPNHRHLISSAPDGSGAAGAPGA